MVYSPAAGVSSQKKSSVEDNLDIGKNCQNLYPFLDIEFVSVRLLQERIEGKMTDDLFELF